MGVVTGAEGHELWAARVQPTLWSKRVSARRERAEGRGLLFVFRVVKDAARVALDGDLEAVVDELLGRRGSQGGAVLKGLRLASEPELGGGGKGVRSVQCATRGRTSSPAAWGRTFV